MKLQSLHHTGYKQKFRQPRALLNTKTKKVLHTILKGAYLQQYTTFLKNYLRFKTYF